MMKAENEKNLVALISELRAEVERLKKIVAERPEPYVIHYHYPPTYYEPTQPRPWWSIYPITTCGPARLDATYSATTTHAKVPVTLTATAGGQY
jgi:hypothetical protein